MSFAYDPAMGTEKDQVRFLVQDTTAASAKFQDEEIEWMISQEANIYMAAAALCDQLVMRTGNVKSKRISEMSITYDPVFYRGLAGNLRARGAGHQIPYAGGISVSDKVAVQSDTDATPPSITRRGLDNPTAPQPGRPPVNPLEQI